jgi:ABC-type dipeptide/oligopeptide/nickel transport system permease subunit
MAAATATPSTESKATQAFRMRTLTELATRRFMRNKAGVLGAIIVLLMLAASLVITLTQPFPDTSVIDASLLPGESPDHPFGTDIAGRDMVRLLAWGTRTSLIIAISVQLFVMVVSLAFGFSAAWFGGAVEFIVMRAIEIATAIPPLLFQALFMLIMGNTIPNLIVALATLAWPELTRIVRAQTLLTREREYINASRSLGAGAPFIAFRHVLPNILNPFIVATSMSIPAVILSESTLSFLGYGLSENMPSLGKMIGVSWQYIQAYWHMALLPTLCLSLLMLGISFLGDGLRDALDPQAG